METPETPPGETPPGETPPGERPDILDGHCHIASVDHIPRSFVDGVITNMSVALRAQGIPIPPRKLAQMYHQKMQDPLCDGLVNEMAAAGISKSVLLIADFTYALKDSALTIEEAFSRHHEVMTRHPGKFEVFGGVDPRWGRDGLALFERAVKELGFRGFKVYPPCGFSPSDPSLFPFYEICAARRLPVVVHIGPTSPVLSFNTASPFLIDEAARLFPGVDFILAHGSVSFAEDCAMLSAFRPNVYFDISGFQGARPSHLTEAGVLAAVSRGINHKIIFGTDWPVFRLQGDQQTFVDIVVREGGPLAEISEAERALILHGNMERLLAGVVA